MYCKSLKELGFNPLNILDIGACYGNWTREVYNLFPQSNYLLIEPIDYKELKELNKNGIKIINALLNNEPKLVDWYEMRNTGDSIFKETTQYYKNCEPVKKMSIDLDSLLIENQIEQNFDLIKIDVQGAELLVLEGGKNTIKNASFIVLEMPFIGQYNKGAPTFLEYIKFMDDNNFIPYDIIEMHKSDYLLFQIDIMFINKNHKINDLIQNKINSMG